MLVYSLFIAVVAGLLYVDYATNLKVIYKANKIKINHLAIFGALGSVIVFAGFRYEIGYDYPKYLAGFLFDSELKHWEPLFNFLTRLIREINFGLDSQALFVLFSFLTIMILFISIKRLTPYYRTSLIIYLLIPGLFLNSFSVVRQAIAMAIILYALFFLTVEKDNKKFIAYALVAFLFHYSSIFVTLTYFIFGRYFNRSYSWIIYLTGILLSFMIYLTHVSKYILLALPGKFSSYAQWEIEVSPLKLIVVNLFFIFLVLQKKQFVKTRLQRYLLNSMFLATLIFNIFADYTYVTRIAQYFLIAEVILVPMYIYSFSSKLKRQLVGLLFLTYYLLNFNYALYRDKTNNKYNDIHALVPYKNYFFEDIKSDKRKYQQRWIKYWHEIGVLK